MDPPADSAGLARLRFETKEEFDQFAREWASFPPYAWSNGPDDRYAVHQHGYAKLLMCAAGSITFLVGSDAVPVALAPGEGFVLPPGTPHAAVVGPAGCTCLEAHRPDG